MDALARAQALANLFASEQGWWDPKAWYQSCGQAPSIDQVGLWWQVQLYDGDIYHWTEIG